MPAAQPIELGRRIVIWGVTGSGKTSLARGLAERLDVPRIELDAIRHKNGFDSVDWDVFRDILTEQLKEGAGGWVLDGNYGAIRDVYVSRADTLLWIHLPWRISFWRLFQRTVGRAWTREPLYNANGPRESWRLSFLNRKSILWWSISRHRQGIRVARERIAGLPDNIRVNELASAGEVAALWESAKKGATSDALHSSDP